LSHSLQAPAVVSTMYLSSNLMVSEFAFKFDLYRYTEALRGEQAGLRQKAGAAESAAARADDAEKSTSWAFAQMAEAEAALEAAEAKATKADARARASDAKVSTSTAAVRLLRKQVAAAAAAAAAPVSTTTSTPSSLPTRAHSPGKHTEKKAARTRQIARKSTGGTTTAIPRAIKIEPEEGGSDEEDDSASA
jgi:hypothetical protein